MANLELCNKKEFVEKEIKKLHNKSVCIRAWEESLVPRFHSPLIEIKLKMQNRWLKITAFANGHPRILACFCVVSPFFYDYWHLLFALLVKITFIPSFLKKYLALSTFLIPCIVFLSFIGNSVVKVYVVLSN